jgi:hypothetical protein
MIHQAQLQAEAGDARVILEQEVMGAMMLLISLHSFHS